MAVQLINKSLFHSFQSDAIVCPAVHSQIAIIGVLNLNPLKCFKYNINRFCVLVCVQKVEKLSFDQSKEILVQHFLYD